MCRLDSSLFHIVKVTIPEEVHHLKWQKASVYQLERKHELLVVSTVPRKGRLPKEHSE